MKIQLIEGYFDAKDAIEIIAQMIHVKIKFYENKINNANNEEDSKMREEKIKQLQKNGSTMIYTGMLSLLNGNQHRITFKSSQT